MAEDEPIPWRVDAPETGPSKEPAAETAADVPAAGAEPRAGDAPVDQLVQALLRAPEVGEAEAGGDLPAATVPATGSGGRRVRRPVVVTAGLAAVAAILVVAFSLGYVGNGNAAGPGSSGRSSDAVATSAAPSTGPTATPSVLVTPQPTPQPTPNLSPDGGVVVFDDDFQGARKGWATGSPTTLTALSITPQGYVIAASGQSTDHLIASPQSKGYQALAVTADGSQASGRGSAGFGVTCQAAGRLPSEPTPGSAAGSPRASGQPGVIYEFIVLNSGPWLVERRDADPDLTAPPVVLMHGTTTTTPGSHTISVTGICATSADGQRVRLAMYINGLPITEVGDFTDDPAIWKGGVVVSTGDVPATVTIHRFEVRDLG
jgi:hypothetical protein